MQWPEPRNNTAHPDTPGRPLWAPCCLASNSGPISCSLPGVWHDLEDQIGPCMWLELSGSIMGALNGHMPPCGLAAEVAGVQRVEAERYGVKIKAHLTTAHHFHQLMPMESSRQPPSNTARGSLGRPESDLGLVGSGLWPHPTQGESAPQPTRPHSIWPGPSAPWLP